MAQAITDEAARPAPVVSARTAASLLLMVILLWGANWPVLRLGVELMPPLTLAVVRLGLAGLVFFAVTAATGELQLPDRRDVPIVIWVGVLQMALFIGLVCIALQWVPAGRSSILAYTTPLWVVPLARLWLGETLTAAKVAGLVLGLGGIAVLFDPAALDWQNGKVIAGHLLLLGAALAWAINMVQVRAHRWIGSPLSLAPWQTLVAFVALLPVALLMEAGRPIQWGGQLAWIILYNALIGSALCFWAMLTVNRALPAVTTSLGSLGTPAVGLLLSAWWLGEAVTLHDLGGLLLVAAGLALVAVAESRVRAR